MAELPARSVTPSGEGRYIFDFGQDIVGWARLQAPGAPGRAYTLRFAEMLREDGQLYTENYRAARSTDVYTCKGAGVESWEPSFTFHGFRYAELDGVPEGVIPQSDWLTGIVLHNDMPPTGSFESSHPMLNQLQSNIQWGQRGNFLAVPTDCPQRDERLGWTGDAQVFCATANFNFNTLAFFVKWCTDLRDSQLENGGIPWVVPNLPELEQESSSSAWGDAAVIVPWEVYRSFGYKRILEDNYQMMVDWVRYYEEHPKTEGLIHDGYTFGDWLQPYSRKEDARFGETDTALIGTVYFARCVDLLGRACEVLGRTKDAEARRAQLARIARAFERKFFDQSGKLTTEHETQTGYLLALAFDLLAEEIRPQALEHLRRLIVDVADGHLRTGFLGTPLIAPVLTRFGMRDLAYGVLFKTTYPGWFYSIEQGATTLWERWNSFSKEDGFGDASMNSFNHYVYGSIGEWLYGSVAGLTSAAPGYRRIEFHPVIKPKLSWAEAELDTPFGPARSRWEVKGDVTNFEFQVPPNATGTVRVGHEPGLLLEPGTHRFRMDADGALTKHGLH